MSDPVVKVECFGEIKHTRVLKQTLNGRFDEVLHFECFGLASKEIETSKVIIRVMDSNTLRRDFEIGSFEFDLSTIYYSLNHEIFNQWVALTNSTAQSIEVQGYLKVSLVCLGPGDEQFIHPNEDAIDLSEEFDVLLPPKIEQIGYLVVFNFYNASDLIRTDFGLRGNSCDPYFVVQFAGTKIHSSVQKGTEVSFNECIEIAVMEPIMANNVIISLYDRDIGKKDDLLGRIILQYDEIKKGFLSSPRWFYLYGASGDANENPLAYNNYSTKMNEAVMEGSTYRGKILLSAAARRVHAPKSNNGLKIEPFYSGNSSFSNYILQVDLYQANELPLDQDWQVLVTIANITCVSSTKASVRGLIKFYETIRDSCGSSNVALNLPSDANQCPDIIIYLSSKKKRISYFRFNFKELLESGFSNSPKWISLKEDKSLDFLKKGLFPGNLLIGVRVGHFSELPSILPLSARPIAAHVRMSEALSAGICQETEVKHAFDVGTFSRGQSHETCSFKLHIISAVNLPAMDSFSHSSDPYVKALIGNRAEKTRFIKKQLNPFWNEEFKFEDIPLDSKFVLKVKDHDIIGKSKPIGEFNTTIRNLYSSSAFSKWVGISQKHINAKLQFELDFEPLKEVKGDINAEAVSAASILSKVKSDYIEDDSHFYEPAEFQCHLRVLVYSAKKLISEDASGFSDPFVVVRCAGLEARTTTKKNTVNPVYYETLELVTPLPESECLIPDLQVLVYDQDIGGLFKSCIGRVAIPFRLILKRNSAGKDPVPEWFDLFDCDLNPLNSSILLAFEAYHTDSDSVPPKPILNPLCKSKVLEVFTLGFRNLSNFWGIQKPFVEFELFGKKSIKTNASCFPSSNNPNILHYYSTQIDIPENLKLTPVLGISLKDACFGGLFTRLLGAAIAELDHYNIERTSLRNSFLLKNDASEHSLDSDLNISRSTALNSQYTNQEVSEQFIKEIVESSVRNKNEALKSVELAIVPAKAKDSDEVIVDLEDEDAIDSVSELISKAEPKWTSVVFGDKSDQVSKDDVPFYLQGRTIVDNELEDVFNLSPFDVIPIISGDRECGLFKGIIRVSEKPSLRSDFNLEQLLRPNKVFVRLYVTRCENLTPKDFNGSCDPYLIVRLGNDHVSLRSKYFKNTCNPMFYESFEFSCQIPGVSQIQVEVWDYDGIKDDLVGVTRIDVEDRWFSNEWKNVEIKPLERRTLKNFASQAPQGKIELWLEILSPQEAKINPLLDLKPPSPMEYELRVIVWETKNVVIKDLVNYRLS
jgi:hypothetical protein